MNTNFEGFHFLEPNWLLVGAGALVALWTLAGIASYRRRRALERFALRGPRMAVGVSPVKRATKLALLSLGIASLFASAARPVWGGRLEEAERRGVDILFAVDTSRSMMADDLRPNRLTRAQIAVRDLVREFEGDRAGLIAFAGDAFLQCPLTLDRTVFESSLAELDTELIPRGGTNIAAALREAVTAYGDVDHDKLLVLLTDGENLEGEVVETARWAAAHGVRVFTVGVGTPEPTPIAIVGPDGRRGLVRDGAGQAVLSALDEDTLRQIAEVSGGAYEALGADGSGLERLYAQYLSHLPKHAVAARERRVYDEGFQWPLGLGLVLLLLEPMIGERRWRWWRVRRRASSASLRPAASAALAGMLLLFGASGAAAAQTAPADSEPGIGARIAGWVRSVFGPPARRAEQAYRSGDYEQARSLWERSAEAQHRFNAGAAAYRAGDYAAAEEDLAAALTGARPELQQSVYYNLGNTRFRRGEQTLASDREATKRSWRAAIEAYEAALRLDAEDEDARTNLEIVRRRLAELEEDEQQDQQQSQSQSCDNPGEQQGGEQQGGEQQGGEQQGGEQQGGEQQGGEQQGGEQQGGEQQGGEQQGGEQQGGEQQGGEQQGGEQQGGEQQGGEQQGGEQQGGEQQGGEQQGGEQQGGEQQGGEQQGGEQQGGEQQGGEQQGGEQQGGEQQGGEQQGGMAAGAGGEEAEEGQQVQFGGSTGPGEHVGRLSREQALGLLRSLRAHERRYPAQRRGEGPSQQPVMRNW